MVVILTYRQTVVRLCVLFNRRLARKALPPMIHLFEMSCEPSLLTLHACSLIYSLAVNGWMSGNITYE